MTCSGSFASSFFFWACLSGVFTGFALSRLTRWASRGNTRSTNWKWIAFSLYLSVGVLLALAAAFVPSSLCLGLARIRVSHAFLDLRILYIFLGGLTVGFAGLRFKRAVGIPLLVVLSVVLIAAVSLKYPWREIEPNRPVAEVRLLSISDRGRSIEFTPDSGGTYFYELDGSGVRFELMTLKTSDYYFFVEKPFMYRFESVSSAADRNSRISISNHRGAESSYQTWLQDLAESLPGWEVVPLIIEADRLLPLFRYVVYLDGEEGARIELVQPSR